MELLTAGEGERYAGQGVNVSGFKDCALPPEFKQAKEHKLLPVFVMSNHMNEVSKALQTLSQNVKVWLIRLRPEATLIFVGCTVNVRNRDAESVSISDIFWGPFFLGGGTKGKIVLGF